MRGWRRTWVTTAVAALPVICNAATGWAAEGFWPPLLLPKYSPISSKIAQAVTPHIVEFSSATSGAIVSATGLVAVPAVALENCGVAVETSSLGAVSPWVAEGAAQEQQCPGLKARRLVRVSDITRRIDRAARARVKSGNEDALSDARQTESDKIVETCSAKRNMTCEALSFAGAAHVQLYEYQQISDVRIAFLPDRQLQADPNEPAFSFGVALVRLYRRGRPLSTRTFFEPALRTPEPNAVLLGATHPQASLRYVPVAKLEYMRQVVLPFTIERLRSRLAILTAPGVNIAKPASSFVSNIARRLEETSRLAKTLADADVMKDVRFQELQVLSTLRKAKDDADARLQLASWPALERAYEAFGPHQRQFAVLAGDLQATGYLLPIAQQIAAKQQIRGSGKADTILHLTVEEQLIGEYLESLRQAFGDEHPAIVEILKKKSPRERAAELIKKSQLKNENGRWALQQAAPSPLPDDPLVSMMRTWIEPRVEATQRNERLQRLEHEMLPLIRKAHARKFPSATYPAADGSLRLSWGKRRGDAFMLSAAASDWPAWRTEQTRIPTALPYSMEATLDLGTDVSGPVFDSRGRLVGIIISQSGEKNTARVLYRGGRTGAKVITIRALIYALRRVYQAPRLSSELSARLRLRSELQ